MKKGLLYVVAIIIAKLLLIHATSAMTLRECTMLSEDKALKYISDAYYNHKIYLSDKFEEDPGIDLAFDKAQFNKIDLSWLIPFSAADKNKKRKEYFGIITCAGKVEFSSRKLGPKK